MNKCDYSAERLPAAVWGYLRDHPHSGAAAIVAALKVHPSQVKRLLEQLIRREHIIRVSIGCYRIADDSLEPDWIVGDPRGRPDYHRAERYDFAPLLAAIPLPACIANTICGQKEARQDCAGHAGVVDS